MCKYIYILILLLSPLTVNAADTSLTDSDVSTAAAAAANTSKGKKEPVKLQAEPSATVEEKRESFNLTEYDPIYFLYSSQTSKVQASFKYKLLKNSNFYLSYTQLLFWNLNAESSPIIDTNYNPEMFYRFENLKYVNDLDIVAGHKSNGKDADTSRSYNYVGVAISPKFLLSKSTSLETKLKIRYIDASTDNPDLLNYLGPFELQGYLTSFSYGLIEKAQFGGRIYTGGKFGEQLKMGGQEVGVSFRIRGLQLTPSFFIQYFQGEGESLLQYNMFQRTFRVGLIL